MNGRVEACRLTLDAVNNARIKHSRGNYVNTQEHM